ncbi:MAG: hypothetical protein WAK19_16825 [Candidatus Cybelea sp.]
MLQGTTLACPHVRFDDFFSSEAPLPERFRESGVERAATGGKET